MLHRVIRRLPSARRHVSTDLYTTLSSRDIKLTRQSSSEDIKAAFLHLAKQTHPDTADVDEHMTADEHAARTAKFREIVAAYDVLKDDDRRSLYDKRNISVDGMSVADQVAAMRREEKIMQEFWAFSSIKRFNQQRSPRKEGVFEPLDGCIRGDCRRLCFPCKNNRANSTAARFAKLR